jgi:hypothetical protein
MLRTILFNRKIDHERTTLLEEHLSLLTRSQCAMLVHAFRRDPRLVTTYTDLIKETRKSGHQPSPNEIEELLGHLLPKLPL